MQRVHRAWLEVAAEEKVFNARKNRSVCLEKQFAPHEEANGGRGWVREEVGREGERDGIGGSKAGEHRHTVKIKEPIWAIQLAGDD